MSTFKDRLRSLTSEFQVKIVPSVAKTEIERVLDDLGVRDSELSDLYAVTNGISFGWFKVLPIEDKTRIKYTWDSIQRANDLGKTEYLARDSTLLRRFVVFGDIGLRRAALLERGTRKIWYEDGEIHRTVSDLLGFVETCLREVREL